jgi:hypothetical protein
MATIAEDYNNPGNLRPPKGVTYDGQIGIGENGFAIFETPEFGRKALINDIQHKMKNGLNTPDSFIDRYSPSGDNSEESRDNYKIHLMNQLGLKSSDEPFPENSHEKLADAIAQFEGGIKTQEPTNEETKKAIDQVSNQTVEKAQPQKLDTLPITAQSLITGGVGGIAGASLGATKYPIAWGVKQLMNDNKAPEVQAPVVQESAWPGNRTPVKIEPSRSEKQTLSTGDKSEMTGRERQLGYTEATSQQKARKETQYQNAKNVGLNPTQAFAQHPDVASTPGGVLASKETIDALANQRALDTERKIARTLNLAKSVGGEWQKIATQAANLAQTGTPEQKNVAMRFLDKIFSGLGKFSSSFPGRVGQIGFGLGASVPMAVEEFKNQNPKTAGAILAGGTALGALGHYFPKTVGGLGLAANVGYDVTHPQEASSRLSMSEISPTAFMGMPEELTNPFAQQPVKTNSPLAKP